MQTSGAVRGVNLPSDESLGKCNGQTVSCSAFSHLIYIFNQNSITDGLGVEKKTKKTTKGRTLFLDMTGTLSN